MPDNGWQPIETAPRDGSAFLAFAGNDMWLSWRFDLDNAYGSTHCWYGVTPSMGSDGSLKIEPTHWMPLPNPPAQQHDSRERE